MPLLIFQVVAVILAGVGVPLALNRVPPNPLYGFRTRATLENPQIWYAANRRTGIDLVIAGGIYSGATALLFDVYGNTPEFGAASAGLLLALLAVVFLRGARTARRAARSIKK